MDAPDAPAARVEVLLQLFFADLEDRQPPEVTGYLAAGLVEEDETDSEELRDTLAGFSPNLGCLPVPQQRQLVDDLLQRVGSLLQEVEAAPASQLVQPTAMLASMAAETLSRLDSLAVSSSTGAITACGDGEGRQLGQAQQRAVAALRELCALPDACDAFMAHVIVSKGSGDVEAAAVWMLECPDLAAAQLTWQQAQQRQRQEEEQERRQAALDRQIVKKQIVNKFHLQAVPNGPAVTKGKPATFKAWGGDGGAENKRQARYREGQVVTSRGEKYIVEKGEEWDGGSKGKVYTKGKRGKGFV